MHCYFQVGCVHQGRVFDSFRSCNGFCDDLWKKKKLVKYSIPRAWNDVPWISPKPLSLPLPAYFPNFPLLVSMFNRTSIVKSLDTLTSTKGGLCRSRLEGELQRYANRIWTFCSLPGSLGLPSMASAGFAAVMDFIQCLKMNSKLL